MLALSLAFVCAFAWAGLDATRKQMAGSVGALELTCLLTLGQMPIFVVWMLSTQTALDPAPYGWIGAAEIALNLTANVLFFRAMSVSPLSVTIPFLAFTPVFTAIIATVVDGTLPVGLEWLGIVAVIGGAVLLAAGEAKSSGRSLGGVLKNEKGVALMLMTAICWAGTINFDRVALEHASPATHALIQNGSIGVVILAFLTVRGRLDGLAKAKPIAWWIVLSVVLAAIAFGVQLVAVQMGLGLGLVETIKRAIGLLMAVVIGKLAFHEGITLHKVAAVVLMAAGAALLML